eukprot:TRINITY_DN9373_c0_g1_i1.p1 TRINITY_DN9373_c0_g1~~TRINITY_DN9373_c0_g1_i1.p1  ORF type:complete len:297 (+),score=54.31 TRINITY_DN9373_c0_g1_i1:209-1099(+)
MAKTLITGSTGGMGSAVVEFLSTKIENKSTIAVLVRNAESEQARNYAKQGLEVRIGDYNDSTSLINAFNGIEKLYFVSGNDLVARGQQHENVVNAAKKTGIKHIFYTSTVRKDESPEAPLFPVVSGHVTTENLIRESGITYTFLRHNLYAEIIIMMVGDRARLLQSKSIYLPVKNGKTAFVPRRNLAEVEANMLADSTAHENKIYTLSGSEKLTFEEVGKIISGVIGEQINFVSPSVEEFETTVKSFGIPQKIVDMLSWFSQAIANGELDDDNSDLERLLGRKTDSMKSYLEKVYT